MSIINKRFFANVALASALSVCAFAGTAERAMAASNIVAQGYLSNGLVGSTLYYWQPNGPNDPVIVREIDEAHGQVLVQWQNGSTSWVPAAELYTREEADLADRQWNAGWSIFGKVATFMMTGSGDGD